MGAIRVGHQRAWVVARWAVRYVLDQANLSEFTESLANRISEAIRIDSGYLDLEEATPHDRVSFAMHVKRLADSLVQAGPNSLSTPSMSDSFVASLRELQHLVETSAEIVAN